MRQNRHGISVYRVKQFFYDKDKEHLLCLHTIKNPAFPSYYHDTWTLLKNYRSVSWSIEVSDYNLQAEFRTEYGCASEAVLDGLEASNSNTHLESYVHSLERSKRMLQLINSAIDLMRKKHEKGELYYWILYYTYLAPHHYANNYEILHFLELKGMPMSMRNYYLRREEAINVLSSVLWGYTSTDCEELINRLLPE